MPEHSRPLTKVVMIGGGYAGTVAANRLRMRADVDITLVNSRPVSVDRVRLVVGSTGAAPSMRGAAEFAFPVAEFWPEGGPRPGRPTTAAPGATSS